MRSTSAAPALTAAVTVANVPAAGGACKHGTGHGGRRLLPAETAGESSAASPVPQAYTRTPKDKRTQTVTSRRQPGRFSGPLALVPSL